MALGAGAGSPEQPESIAPKTEKERAMMTAMRRGAVFFIVILLERRPGDIPGADSLFPEDRFPEHILGFALPALLGGRDPRGPGDLLLCLCDAECTLPAKSAK